MLCSMYIYVCYMYVYLNFVLIINHSLNFMLVYCIYRIYYLWKHFFITLAAYWSSFVTDMFKQFINLFFVCITLFLYVFLYNFLLKLVDEIIQQKNFCAVTFSNYCRRDMQDTPCGPEYGQLYAFMWNTISFYIIRTFEYCL